MQLDSIDQGGSREVVQAMVNADYQTLAQRDRLRILCVLAYSSDYCPDHHLHHGGGDIEILHITHLDGCILVPEHQLPRVLTEGVMVRNCCL